MRVSAVVHWREMLVLLLRGAVHEILRQTRASEEKVRENIRFHS